MNDTSEAEACQAAREAYAAYIEACEAENLNPLTPQMWLVHGSPTGPV